MMNYDVPAQHAQVGFTPGRIPWRAFVAALASDPRFNIDGKPFSLGEDFPEADADTLNYGFMLQPGRHQVSGLAVHNGFTRIPGNSQGMARTGTPDNTAVLFPEHAGFVGPNAAYWRNIQRHELNHLLDMRDGVKGAADDPFNEVDAYAVADGRKKFRGAK